MLEQRAGGGQRIGEIAERELGMGVEVLVQALGLRGEGGLALGGEQQRPRRQRRLHLRRRRLRGLRSRRLLEDDMGVGAGQPDGGDPGAAGAAVGWLDPGREGVDDADG